MADNLTLHMASERRSPVVSIKPAGIDIIGKVIKRSGLHEVHIQNSVLYGMIIEKENEFSIIRSNCTDVIGKGIHISFALNKVNQKMLNNIKGNHSSLIFDNGPDHYFFTNGDCTFLISKVKPQKINTLLPISTNGIEKKTYKSKQIKMAMGNTEFVDLFIYDSQISLVLIPNSNIFMSLDPLSTAELMQKKPDMVLRSHHFLHILGDEVTFVITLFEGVYWLYTSINVTQDVTIEQFEPLKMIK